MVFANIKCTMSTYILYRGIVIFTGVDNRPNVRKTTVQYITQVCLQQRSCILMCYCLQDDKITQVWPQLTGGQQLTDLGVRRPWHCLHFYLKTKIFFTPIVTISSNTYQKYIWLLSSKTLNKAFLSFLR